MAQAKHTLSKKPRRVSVTRRTAECRQGEPHPLDIRLSMIAQHWAEHIRQGETNDAAKLAFAGYQAEMVATLITTKPRNLSHVVTMLALARGYAPLKDAVDLDAAEPNKLNWDAADLHERLLILNRVIGEAIYALCLMGGKVHEAAKSETNEEDWRAYQTASFVTGR